MAKYFYVYNIAGVEDSIVKMFNTDTGAMGEKSVKKDRMDGFIDGIKTSGFILNKELADADVAEAEAKRILAEAIDKLTEKEQKVIALYYFEELTLKEISNVLEVSESRVSQLHTKALKKMKERLGDQIDLFGIGNI